jgi:hypothetical protein
MINYYVNFEGPNAFWQFLLSAFLAPSQGFWNSIIYFQRAHSFQRWKQVLCSCWQASSKEQGLTSACHPTEHAEGRTQETANESQYQSHEVHVHEPDVPTDEEGGEEEDLFSAPAAHWANEELPNPERHSNVAETMLNVAASFGIVFQQKNSSPTNDDPQQLATERDEPTDQDETGSESESPAKLTATA